MGGGGDKAFTLNTLTRRGLRNPFLHVRTQQEDAPPLLHFKVTLISVSGMPLLRGVRSFSGGVLWYSSNLGWITPPPQFWPQSELIWRFASLGILLLPRTLLMNQFNPFEYPRLVRQRFTTAESLHA